MFLSCAFFFGWRGRKARLLGKMKVYKFSSKVSKRRKGIVEKMDAREPGPGDLVWAESFIIIDNSTAT